MLDMGFIDAVREIVCEIPTERQTLLFSATLGGEIQRLSRGILKDPVRVEVAPPATTVETVDQRVIFVEQDDKQHVLEGLIQEHEMTRAIIFTRTKVGATKLASRLRQRGYKAAPIHSDRSQSERVATLEAFRAGKVHLLIATDIAARGIDIDHVGHVINYDVPYSAEDYVHRIGRTARAGRTGMAIMLATSRDRSTLHAIERLVGFSLSGNDRNGSRGTSKTTREPVSEVVNGNSAPRSSNGRRRSGGSRSAVVATAERGQGDAERNGRNGASRESTNGTQADRSSNGRRGPDRPSNGRPATSGGSDNRRHQSSVSTNGRHHTSGGSRNGGHGTSSGPRDDRPAQGSRRSVAIPAAAAASTRDTQTSSRRRSGPQPERAAVAVLPSAQAPGIFQSVLGRIFRRHRGADAAPEAARL